MDYLTLLNDNCLVIISKYCRQINVPINFVSGVAIDLIMFMKVEFSHGYIYIDNMGWLRGNLYLNRYDKKINIHILNHSYDGDCDPKLRMMSDIGRKIRIIIICDDCIADGTSEYSLR